MARRSLSGRCYPRATRVMANLVVDSNVWVAFWLRQLPQYNSAAQFIQEFQQGQHQCHLPYLVLIEICAAILREVPRPGLAIQLISQVRQTFLQWEQMGIVTWYELTQQRAGLAIQVNSVLQSHLKGADSVIAALAEELNLPLKTFDTEIQQRYSNVLP